MVDGLKILVTDDSATMRQIIKGQLRKAGYKEVGEAEDGAHALDELRDGEYNFLVTDWNMPHMDGLELIKRLRSEARFKSLPILVVTTRGGKDDVVTAIKQGANNYVVKPFGPSQLSDKIDRVMESMSKGATA
jgi:two-component system chemotaxis response regulator CheY